MKIKNLIPKFSDIKKLSKLPLSELPIHVKQKIRDKAIENAGFKPLITIF